MEAGGALGMQREAHENLVVGYLRPDRVQELWHLTLAVRGVTTGVSATRADYDAAPKEWKAAVKSICERTEAKLRMEVQECERDKRSMGEIIRALVKDTHYLDDGNFHGLVLPALEGMMRYVLTCHRRNLRINPEKCNVVASTDCHAELNVLMEPLRRVGHKLGSKNSVDWEVTEIGVQLGIPYAIGQPPSLWTEVKKSMRERVVEPLGRLIKEMMDYPGFDTKQAALWAARRWAFSCLTYTQQAWGLQAPESVWKDVERQAQALLAMLVPREKALGTEEIEDIRKLAWAERNARMEDTSGVWRMEAIGNGPHNEVRYPGAKGGWRYPQPVEKAPFLAAAIWPAGTAKLVVSKKRFGECYRTIGGEVKAVQWVDGLNAMEETIFAAADVYEKRRMETRRLRGSAHAFKNTAPSYPLHRITDAQFDLGMVITYGDLRHDEQLRKLIDRDPGVFAFRGSLVEDCFRTGLKWFFPLARVAAQPRADRMGSEMGPNARKRMDTVAVMRDGTRVNFDIHHSNTTASSYLTKYKTLEAHCQAVDKKKREHYADTHRKPIVAFFSLTGGIYADHCKQLMRFARQCQVACGGSANEAHNRTKLDWETGEGRNAFLTEMAVGCLKATENAVEAARNRAVLRNGGDGGRATDGAKGRFECRNRGGGNRGLGARGRLAGGKGGRERGRATDGGDGMLGRGSSDRTANGEQRRGAQRVFMSERAGVEKGEGSQLEVRGLEPSRERDGEDDANGSGRQRRTDDCVGKERMEARMGGGRSIGVTGTGTSGGLVQSIMGSVALTPPPSDRESGVNSIGRSVGRCMDIGRGGAP